MRRVFTDVVLPLAVALALAFVVQAALAKPYEIPTGSMEPTIMPHDRVVANRVIYRFRDIERGDIIVFHPPAGADGVPAQCGAPARDDQPCARPTRNHSDQTFIKRVVATGGDTVAIRDGRTSTETLRRAAEGAAGEAGEIIAEEYAVLDRAGRLQLPREHVEALGLAKRVRLTLEADHIGVWSDARQAEDDR